jgi:hypothetical protein
MTCLFLDFEKPKIMDESPSRTEDNLLSNALFFFYCSPSSKVYETNSLLRTNISLLYNAIFVLQFQTANYGYENFSGDFEEPHRPSHIHTMERTIPLTTKIIFEIITEIFVSIIRITERTKPLIVKYTPYNRNNYYQTFP